MKIALFIESSGRINSALVCLQDKRHLTGDVRMNYRGQQELTIVLSKKTEILDSDKMMKKWQSDMEESTGFAKVLINVEAEVEVDFAMGYTYIYFDNEFEFLRRL